MTRFCILLSLLACVPAAHATILYTNTTYSSDVLQYNSSYQDEVSDDQSFQITGGFAFSLPAGQDYSSLGFDAPLWQPGSGTTTVEIWSGTTPGTELGGVTVTPPSSYYGIVSGSFSPSLTLVGGTTYYLMVYTTSSQVDWAPPPSAPTGTLQRYIYFPGSGGYSEPVSDFLGAFDITTENASVPEPATIAGLLSGLALIVIVRRTKRACGQ